MHEKLLPQDGLRRAAQARRRGPLRGWCRGRGRRRGRPRRQDRLPARGQGDHRQDHHRRDDQAAQDGSKNFYGYGSGFRR